MTGLNKSLVAVACMGGLFFSSCGNRSNSDKATEADDLQQSELLTILVGSYSNPGDTALRIYSFDPANGNAEYISSVPLANASYFTQAPSGIIYAVCESDDSSACVSALRPAGAGKAPEVISTQPVGSQSPCYVAVSPDGRFVVTANYNGSTAAVFPICADGSLAPRRQLIGFTGTGPVADRQEKSHPHCIAFTPDGKYMLVNDLGMDRIHQFAVKAGNDTLVSTMPDKDVEIRPGAGPRHIVFNDEGNIAYLINEIGDDVTVLEYDGENLTPVQYIAADTIGARGAGDIHLSPDGKHLYASLRLKNDGVVTFDVDPETGLLTYRAHTPTVGHPRNFTLSPDGSMMLVAGRDDNAVQLFTVDRETGVPTDTGKKIEVSRPVCVKFVDLSAR